MQPRPAASYMLPSPASSITTLQNRPGGKLDFLIGSCDLSDNNHIHLFEYDEDTDKLHSVFNFTHPDEIISCITSPSFHDRCFTIHADHITHEVSATLWKFPSLDNADSLNLDITAQLSLKAPEDPHYTPPNLTSADGPLPPNIWRPTYDVLCGNYGLSTPYLKPVSFNSISHLVWNRVELGEENARKCLLVTNNTTHLYDLEHHSKPVSSTTQTTSSPIVACDWNLHREGSVFITASGHSLTSWDTRTMTAVSNIDYVHDSITTFKCNPNRPYVIATGGSDGSTHIWDTRKLQGPTISVRSHHSGVTSLAYNNFYDQMMLSTGEDGRVCLWSFLSTSSTPDPDADNYVLGLKEGQCADRLVVDFGGARSEEGHSGRICGSVWSADSAWVYAVLTDEGKLSVHQLPTGEKYKLML